MTNQYKVFSAVMSQMNTAIEATNEAITSSGATMRQNEVYMGSLEAKTNLLKAEFEKLVLGKGGLQDFAKLILEIGTAILKVANSDFGQAVIKLTALFVLIQSGIKLFTLFKASAFGLSVEAWGLNSAIKALTISLASNPLFWGALAVVGISALYSWFKKLNPTLEENKEKLKELKEEYTNTSNELEDAESSLRKVQERIEEINDLDEIDTISQKELNNLRLEQQELENTIALLKDKKQLEYQDYAKQAEKTVNKKILVGEKSGEESKGGFGGWVNRRINNILGTESYVEKDRVELLKESSQAMITYGEQIDRLSAKKEQGITLTQTEQDVLNKAIVGYKKASKNANTYATELKSETENLDEENETRKYAQEGLDAYSESLKNRSEIIEDATGLTNVYLDTEDDLLELTEEELKAFEKLKEKFSLSSTSIDKLKTSFESLAKANKEINSQGKLSIETYQELMELSPAYMQALFDETGALRDDVVAQEELYKIKVEQMALDQAEQLIELAEGFMSEADGVNQLNKALSQNNSLLWDNAYARIASLDVDEDTRLRLLNQIDQYKKWSEEAIKSIHTYATTKSDSATKEITSDLEKQKEALSATKKEIQATADSVQEIVDNYKKVFSYLSSKLDEQKDALEKQKDLEIDAIEEQINALKEQKEAEEDYWDEKIDALKSQNDALKDQLEYEQLLENLAKAKSTKVKVYREGIGFVYETDASAVASAQQQIDEYNTTKKYEEELALLEKSKEDKQKSYEEQINNLENYKDAVSKNYEDQIKILEDYKDNLEKQVNSYETEQNRLLTLQMTGIDTEQDNWTSRLSNLSTFVDSYNAKLAELEKYQNQIKEIEKQEDALEVQISNAKAGDSGSGSGGSGNGGNGDEKPKTEIVYVYNGREYKSKESAEAQRSADIKNAEKIANTTARLATISGIKSRNIEQKVTSYASGASSISGNQVAIVGEDPNKEIVLGSKANGLLTRIDNGGGVVNAKSTRTLAGLLNQIGSYAMNSFGSPSLSSNSMSNNNTTTISIGNVNVQANNADDFVQSMMQFKMQMTQKAYSI